MYSTTTTQSLPLLLITAILTPGLAFAAITDICGIVYLVNSIAQWFGIVVFIVSLMAFFYSAFLFLTNAGDTEKITTARQVLVYAVIGTVIALLATNAVKIIHATTGGTYYSVSQCASLFP